MKKLLKKKVSNTPFFYIIFCIFIFSKSHGQIIFIELKNETLNIEKRNFYFEKITDGRENKKNIGFIKKAIITSKFDLDLKGGVEQSIKKYLDFALPRNSSMSPIVLNIASINISEKGNLLKKTLRTYIRLEFYDSSSTKKIYEVEAFCEEQKTDSAVACEEVIRRLLSKCIKSFSNYMIFQSEKKDDVKPKPPDNIRKHKWNNMLLFHNSFGVNAVGWEYSYYGFVYNEKMKGITMFGLSGGVIQIKPYCEFGAFKTYCASYYSAKLRFWLPSFFFITHIKRNINLNIELQLPVGNEKLVDFDNTETTNSLIGIFSFQGISYFIPGKKSGYTAGFGIYERMMTSEIYPSDLGIKIYVGAKF